MGYGFEPLNAPRVSSPREVASESDVRALATRLCEVSDRLGALLIRESERRDVVSALYACFHAGVCVELRPAGGVLLVRGYGNGKGLSTAVRTDGGHCVEQLTKALEDVRDTCARR